MNKIWVTESGIIHYRKPEMEAKECVEVQQQPDAPMTNDVKTVRDALCKYESQDKMELDFCYEGGSQDAVMCAKAFYPYAKATLDRMIETPAPIECQHEIIDIRNEVIQSGYMCKKCNALFKSGDHNAPIKKEEQIEGLEEAVEFRREIAEFNINRVNRFFGMNKDKPELSLDTILWIAASAYLKLQSATQED